MYNNIKEFFKFAAKNGLFFPAAYDKATNGPSVSLFFSHIAFYLSIVVIIILSIKDINLGAIAAITQSTLMLVFYLLRRLKKASFDLDDKSIALEGDNENDNESKK